jgi:hypothetical protein
VKTYHAEPFNPDIGEKEACAKGAATIAQQMAQLLNRGGGGWTFDGYHPIHVAVKPGSLSALGGGKTTTISFGTLVFSRDDQAAASVGG